MPSSRGFTTSAVTALVCHARIKADEENSTFFFFFGRLFLFLVVSYSTAFAFSFGRTAGPFERGGGSFRAWTMHFACMHCGGKIRR